MSTRKRIEALVEPIEQRAKRATPGPWLWEKEDEDGAGACIITADNTYLGEMMHDHDELFAAHARTDIPTLIAELRSLAECNDAMVCAIKEAVDLLGPEYCDEGKPLHALQRVLEWKEGDDGRS